MEEEKTLLPQLGRKLWQGDKKTKWILVLGILGMMLILLSEFLPEGGKRKKDTEGRTTDYATEEAENQAYILKTESRLKELVQNIEGVGECQVMVTLRQSTQYIYASEDKTTQDRSQDETGENGKKVQQKNGSEKKIVLLDDTEGSRPLVEARIEPEINGVVVVCQGGASSRVQQRVSEAVTTVMGISSTQVCVTPKSQ